MMLYRHRVSIFFQNTPLGRFKKIRRDWNWL